MFDVLLPSSSLSALSLSLAAPVLLLLLKGRPVLQERLMPVLLGGVFAIYAALSPKALASGLDKGVLFRMLPGMEVSFTLNALNVGPCLAISLAAFLGSMFLTSYLQAMGGVGRTRTMALYACINATALGMCQAGSIMTLLLGVELMTLFLLPLVGGGSLHPEGGLAPAAESEAFGSRTLFLYLYGSSRLCLLPAAILLYRECGSLDLAPMILTGSGFPETVSPGVVRLTFWLFVAGFALSGITPFHGWLVSSISESSPMTGFLAGPLAASAGVFGLCKVVVSGFGLEQMAALHLDQPLAWLGAAAVLLGALGALGRNTMRSILAYCTVSQLGYTVLGVATLTGVGIRAGIGILAIFTLSGSALFLVAGAVEAGYRKEGLASLQGLGRRMPWSFGALTAAGLTLIGLPPSAGFLGRDLLFKSIASTGGAFMSAVVVLGTLLLGACLLRIFCITFFRQPEAGVRLAEYREALPGMVVPSCLMAMAAILLGCFPDVLFRLMGV